MHRSHGRFHKFSPNSSSASRPSGSAHRSNTTGHVPSLCPLLADRRSQACPPLWVIAAPRSHESHVGRMWIVKCAWCCTWDSSGVKKTKSSWLWSLISGGIMTFTYIDFIRAPREQRQLRTMTSIHKATHAKACIVLLEETWTNPSASHRQDAFNLVQIR